MYQYGSDFYRYNASFSVQSARRIAPLLRAQMPIGSVVDFGCGQGAWLSVWRECGAAVTGLDGAYVNPRYLLIEASEFRAADLALPVDLGRRFDLVQSLEVAEHLPEASAGRFVDSLVAHGDCVLFSAAVPGQGGEHHVNEQPLAYWRTLFGQRGYRALDYLRPLIKDDPAVQSWYRYNTLLYVRETAIARLPEAVRASRVPDDAPIAEYRPLPDRLRNAVIRVLPVVAADRLARAKASLAARHAALAVTNGTVAAASP